MLPLLLSFVCVLATATGSTQEMPPRTPSSNSNPRNHYEETLEKAWAFTIPDLFTLDTRSHYEEIIDQAWRGVFGAYGSTRAEPFESALKALDTLGGATTNDYRALLVRGTALRFLSRPGEALVQLEAAGVLSPTNTWVLDEWGRTLRDLNHPEKAAAKFEEALQVDQHNLTAYADLATVLCQLERYSEAEQVAENGLLLDKQDPFLHHTLGCVLAREGEGQRALTHLQLAVQLAPENARFHHDLAYGLQLLDRCDEALESVRQAVRLSPDNAVYLERMARILIGLDQVDEALACARRSVAMNGRRLQAHKLVLWCLHDLGRYREELAYAAALTKRFPATAESWELLGKNQARHCSYCRAWLSFGRARRLSPQKVTDAPEYRVARRGCLAYCIAAVSGGASALLLSVWAIRRVGSHLRGPRNKT